MGASNEEAVSLLADLESLWECLDTHFASLSSADWSRPHGMHWTFADVPYHLAYFDSDVVAYPLAHGRDLLPSEQWVARTIQDVNAWNARKFVLRPPDQTVDQSIEQMWASRDAIRALLNQMTDADLDRPVWMPLLAGDWVSARVTLDGCRAHTYAHEAELRLRLGRAAPVPTTSATHAALNTLMGFFPMGLNREQAATAQFTLVMEFIGPGGGAWTIRVADGDCTITEERTGHPDLLITQSPDTFIKTRAQIQDPMVAMQAGEIGIQGMENMGTFMALFPPHGSE